MKRTMSVTLPDPVASVMLDLSIKVTDAVQTGDVPKATDLGDLLTKLEAVYPDSAAGLSALYPSSDGV